MGDTNRHCPDCGAPLATEADDGDNAGCEPGCECSVCASLCWRAWYGNRCQRYPHDWQAEAMALRERLDAAQRAALFAVNRPRDDVDAGHYVELAVFGTHLEATREILSSLDRAGQRIPQEPRRV